MLAAAFGSERVRRYIESVCVRLSIVSPLAIELEGVLRREPIWGVIVTGEDLPGRDMTALARVLDFRTVPVVYCGGITRATARFAAALGKAGNPNLFIRTFEDVPLIERFIEACSPAREQRLYVAALDPMVGRLPAVLRLEVETLLAGRVRSPVTKLVERTGRSEHWVRKALKRAGFADAHSLFLGQCQINIWGFSREPMFSPVDIARKVGYKDRKAMSYALSVLGASDIRELSTWGGDRVIESVLQRTAIRSR